MLSVNSFNPILQYKLDPGEWGSSSAATSATSVSRVSFHESSNIQRFESRANKKGCYVIHKDLYLNLQKSGGYLSATSGKSSVTTYCPTKEKERTAKSDVNAKINSKLRQYGDEELKIGMLLKDTKSKANQSVYGQKLKDIQQRKQALQEKKMRLYTQITLLLVQNLNIDPSSINVDLSA